MGFLVAAYLGFSTDDLAVVLTPDLLYRLAESHAPALEHIKSSGFGTDFHAPVRNARLVDLQCRRRLGGAEQDATKQHCRNHSHGRVPGLDEHIWQVWYVAGPIATAMVTVESGDGL